MPSKTFEVPNISCGHCVMTIKNEVSELAGVSSVEASEDTRQVAVQWDDPASWEQINDLLVEINYPPAPGTN
jgi:copper chaperone